MKKKEKHSFFSGLGRSILQNSPLLICGVLLLVFGLVFDVRILRILSYSLFIAYLLSCSIQSIYSVSSKSFERANEPSPQKVRNKPKDVSQSPDGGAAGGSLEEKR